MPLPATKVALVPPPSPTGQRHHRDRRSRATRAAGRIGGDVKLDIVNAHPFAAAFGTVVDAFEADDVVETGTNLRIHAAQGEWGVVNV